MDFSSQPAWEWPSFGGRWWTHSGRRWRVADSTGFLRNKNAALPARAQKNPLDPQRPEKIWVPAGASGHELSRPKRVSWLPAYGMMAAMSIPVSCVGVKTHVFMNDLVVDQWTWDGASTSHRDFLFLYDV